MLMFIKGLKYIVPCQSRFSRKPIEEIVNEQYQNISRIVKNCLNDHRISTIDGRSKQAFQALKNILHELYSKPLPRKLAKRAKQEHKIVQSIQKLLVQRPDIVIRRTDKSKVFYIGKATDFVRKAKEYMLKTKAYEEITNGRCPLADNLHAVQTLLNYLVTKRVLTVQQRNRLLPKLNQLELGHYYGLPKAHKPGTPLRPIIASTNAPTTLVSKFLNDLLTPIFLKVARETTFINSIDVIRKLEKYVEDGYLQSTTKFITADVTDLYTMIPRQGALEALARFCIRHFKQNRIGTFTIDHIMKMARLILDTNCFAYNDKYYKQIHGGAMGSAFTQVLANIYMLEWEQDLITYQASENEIYGRYIDDIFMTTNQNIDEIKEQLEKANRKDVNIKINHGMGASVDFLDVTITNENGKLRTSIYHKPAAEPYILPFTSDHPDHIHRNIPYAALLRAARIWSHVDNFNSECIRIDMSLLLNDYPPSILDKQFSRFFSINNAITVRHELNDETFHPLHKNLLSQPTRRESHSNVMLNDPVLSPTVLQTKTWDKSIMHPRYQFNKSNSKKLSKEFYKCWTTYYASKASPLQNVKVRLVATTDTTLEAFLIHKKPRKEVLCKMETDSNINN
ncbi:unnamed protein product [Rotaria magnacalcarata]|uniref:Reverse transcriptase domain-containing protein n=1 Tax=Rotaria magnacalcarata TaxID=392030 RepID=A0A816Z4V8_9BILA|nr:unnamed protein product [Rotaria magnacalcarata]CAF4049086.1 unnamed protein product [Rotaria magnacalcarata]